MLWFVRIDFIHVLLPWYGMIPAQIEQLAKGLHSFGTHRKTLVKPPEKSGGVADR